MAAPAEAAAETTGRNAARAPVASPEKAPAATDAARRRVPLMTPAAVEAAAPSSRNGNAIVLPIPRATAPTAPTAIAAVPSATAASLADKPRAIRPAPATTSPAATAAAVITMPWCSLTQAIAEPAALSTVLASVRSVGASVSPISRASPSTADIIMRIEPPRPESIMAAVDLARPAALSMAADIFCISATDDESFMPAVMPRRSKTSWKKASRSEFGILAVALPRSIITSAMGRSFLFASTASTPSALSFFWAAGSAKARMALRKPVPPIEPLRPRFASTPSALPVSSIDRPASVATGPT